MINQMRTSLKCSFNLRLDYVKTSDVSGTPELIYGDGDSSVNMRSLKGCMSLQSSQSKSIKTLEIPKAEHMEILSNEEVISYILKVLV